MNTLSPEQNLALDRFKSGHNLFITGPGGTGKTRLIHHLTQYARCIAQKECQVCAMTGCAAILIGGGAKTLHSWSGMRLGKGAKSLIISSIRANQRAVKNWKQVKVLIIDEVSMLSKKLFEVIEETARTIRRNPAPFGGIQVVFTGDFFQLPPVGSPDEPDTAAFCFESPLWATLFTPANHISLTTVFRQTDPIYKNILMEIRRGTISEPNADILKQYVGREKPAECIPTKLFAVRSKTDFVNKAMFEKLEESEFVMESIIKTNLLTYAESKTAISKDVLDKCAALSASEIQYEIDSLMNNTPCVPRLSLKKGANIMCTVNYDMDRGICNGMQGVVVEILEPSSGVFVPMVRFVNGHTIAMEIHYWQSDEYPTIAIGQYPICLAWALTIHKIQGATLKMAEMDIGKSIFEYGQTYVALSRIESLEGLYLSAFHPQKIKANPRVIEFYDSIPDIQMIPPTTLTEELHEEELVPSTTRKIIL
jgi:ATP-dependent DNA helicase PIF1